MDNLLQKLLPMQPLASVEGRDNDTLMYLIHGLVLVLFVGWAIYYIVVLVKFRQKKNPKVTHSHTPHLISSYVEWVVVFVEFLLLFAFSIPFWAVHQASIPEGKDIMQIKVVAQQFAWNVHYAGPDGIFGRSSARFLNDNPLGLDPGDPNGKDDISTMNQIYLPIDKTVVINLTSKDVIHSFGLPAMRVKQDVIPGMTTRVWFTPNKIGQYEIACSQLCGLGHYRMRGIVNVVSQAILTNGYSKTKEFMTNHTPTPRSQDPEDIQKRNFIKGLTAAVLGFLSLALTWPLISFLLPASGEGSGEKFIKVPNFPAIPTGAPTKMNFESVDVQAFITSNIVYDIWVIKHAADKATVYSPLCPHLNCRYNFDKSKDQFACPCHGSIFNEAGKCIGGPAPRPLDTLPYKIEGGELYVKWELYKAGIPEKVEV